MFHKVNNLLYEYLPNIHVDLMLNQIISMINLIISQPMTSLIQKAKNLDSNSNQTNCKRKKQTKVT